MLDAPLGTAVTPCCESFANFPCFSLQQQDTQASEGDAFMGEHSGVSGSSGADFDFFSHYLIPNENNDAGQPPGSFEGAEDQLFECLDTAGSSTSLDSLLLASGDDEADWRVPNMVTQPDLHLGPNFTIPLPASPLRLRHTQPMLQLDYGNVLSAWEELHGGLSVESVIDVDLLRAAAAQPTLKSLIPSHQKAAPLTSLLAANPNACPAKLVTPRAAVATSKAPVVPASLPAMIAVANLGQPIPPSAPPPLASSATSGRGGGCRSASPAPPKQGCTGSGRALRTSASLSLMPDIPAPAAAASPSAKAKAAALKLLPRATKPWTAEDAQIRSACLARYKEKRAKRAFSKTIRYEMRKINAERRPRIKGRFVKREELCAAELESGGSCCLLESSSPSSARSSFSEMSF